MHLDLKVNEFGLIQHEKYSFLGASPDGICKNGIMLEIKCPFTRKINKTGEIYNHICPAYYWVQVQQQLECCDLEECDFWQCDIGEYGTREEFLKDTDPDEPFRSKKYKYEKGCLVQLIPIDQVEKARRSYSDYEEVIYNSSKFLYPPKIEMTPYQCDNWIANVVSKLDKAEFIDGEARIDSKNKVNFDPKKYVFDKVIYWFIRDSHNVTISRDREWFKEKYPVYEKMWKYVKFLRNNEDKKQIFLEYVNTRKRKENLDILKTVEKICNTEDPNYKLNIAEIIKKIKSKSSYKKSNDDEYNNYMINNYLSFVED